MVFNLLEVDTSLVPDLVIECTLVSSGFWSFLAKLFTVDSIGQQTNVSGCYITSTDHHGYLMYCNRLHKSC